MKSVLDLNLLLRNLLSVIRELQPFDPASGVHFWSCIFHLIFFSDEAWFHLHRKVNSHNRSWSSSNPRLIHRVALHDSKTYVWYGVSTDRFIGLIFFEEQIFHPFFGWLANGQWYAFFHKDSSTAHTARASMVPFRDVFVDRIIGSLWPEHTPDLKR
jgi:hypothetical protein